jgi:hypothetical protein
MYCSVCLNNTIEIGQKGSVEVIINKKQLETGKFLFGSRKNNKEFLQDFEKKVNEFFRWYSQLNYKTKIFSLDLVTSSFHCHNRCKIPLDQKKSVIGLMISTTQVMDVLRKASQKYNIELGMHESELESFISDGSP